jgi:FAD/FMN-containing dehydrogenase
MPQNAQYSAWVSAYWLKQARLPSLFIITPASEQEVSLVVQILSSLGTPFAIRAMVIGGSTPKDEVNTNMRFLKVISFDERSKAVVVGVGALSDDVYQALDPYSVTALRGRAGSIGMVGFFT